jgi:UDP-N-acetylmuramoyl-L-alanyl-D-glutamate--2,6-diaminopimelate ligase
MANSTTKRLVDLVRGIPCQIQGNTNLEVKGVAYHSAAVKPGYLFVAVEGFRVSGADYIDDAANRGATAVATVDLRRLRKSWVVGIQTQLPRRFLAQVANRFYDFPARKVNLVGVTGTNGKTTTTYLLREMARQAGMESGLVGTIEQWDGVERRRSVQTTPESLDLVQMLARMVRRGLPLCVAEVSSHSLELDRVFDLDFRVAVFTNLTQDHLDFHRTIDNYREAKLKLFRAMAPSTVVVTNYDDKVGRDIPHLTKARVVSYGARPDLEPTPDYSGVVDGLRPGGLDCTLSGEGRTWPVHLKLVGRHNLNNLLAAFAAGRALGWGPGQVIAGAEALAAVPGRLEAVTNDRGFGVFVDYAHTPDAVQRVLKTVREFTAGRVVVVMGCGGDRDRTKRPLMGQAAAELADIAVVTSDNPRSEDPSAIISEIVKGMGAAERIVEPDRAAAIERALGLARSGDTVVIAGKGHEDYQIVGTERRHFDDREVATAALGKLG